MTSNVKIAVVLVIFLSLSIGIIASSQIPSTARDQNNTSQTGNVTPISFSGRIPLSGTGLFFGSIIINTTVPEGPGFLPIYKQHFQEGDTFSKDFGSNRNPKQNVTSGIDAPEVAKHVMEQFGGLPPDAQYSGSDTEYLESQTRTGEVIKRDPILTNVYYSKRINGRPVTGYYDQINLELGENGSLMHIYKRWSNLTYVSDVPIISADEAIQRLHYGDIISSINSDSDDISIYNITPGYYFFGKEGNITEPVWFFFGKTESGNIAVFQVYARQFATFTVTPTTQNATLPVRFTDTSDASPTKWLWDFGDGTNSTVQNATHSFAEPGTYNVSLRAWNDLGSDTISKQYTVNDIPSTPTPTVTPTSGTTGKFIDNRSVDANNDPYDYFGNTLYYNYSFFAICSNAGYEFTWATDPWYSDRKNLQTLTINGVTYPNSTQTNYKWNIVDRLDQDATPQEYTQYENELGGWISASGPYYLWYGNNTAARSYLNGYPDWLFPTVENATYIVKLDVTYTDS